MILVPQIGGVRDVTSNPRFRIAILAAALFSFLLAPIAFPPQGSSHEPITTNVRFNKEVIRILQKSCLDCHAAGKIKGDIPLSTYEEARPWAKAIKEEVLEKRMPPYQAVRGFGNFHRNYGLSQREVDLLVSWVEGGAPKGEAKDLPTAAASNGWSLGRPDVVLNPARETRVPADDRSNRCYLLPTGFKQDQWLSGVEFKPGNEQVVYSATISLLPRSVKAPVTGAACGPASESREGDLIGTWVPGQAATRFPSETAKAIPRGARLLLRIRYQGGSEPTVDRSSVGLFLATEEPQRSLTNLTIAAPPTNIAPVAQSVRVASSYRLPTTVDAVGLRPLLFPLAQSIEATAYRPDGTAEVLVWAKDRRFDWAPTYFFKKPVELPEGTRIEVVAYVDNSAGNPNNPHDPPKTIRFTSPLCEFFFAEPGASKLTAIRGGRR